MQANTQARRKKKESREKRELKTLRTTSKTNELCRYFCMYDILKDTMYVHDPSKTVLTLFRFQSSFASDIKLNWNFTLRECSIKNTLRPYRSGIDFKF